MKSLFSMLNSASPKVKHTMGIVVNPASWVPMFAVMLLVGTTLMMAKPDRAYAADISGSGYVGSEARRMQNVITGTIEDLRMVRVQNNTGSPLQYGSAAVGAIIGGLIGQNVGEGATRIAATTAMSAAGGFLGYKANEMLSNEEAVEFIVTLDDGRTIAITQGKDAQTDSINIGDRVRLIQGQSVRVARLFNQTAVR